jgi:nicotinate-nucleotide adenylyltransferase
MVALATTGIAGFIPSPVEVLGRGPSYTVDTVRRFRRAAGREAEIFFLIGADSLREIETWKDHRALLESCHFIVLPRGGEETSALPREVARRLHEVGEGEGRRAASAAREPAIFLWRSEEIACSSSDIRRRIGGGEPLGALLHPGVEDYIRKTGLYAGEPSAT